MTADVAVRLQVSDSCKSRSHPMATNFGATLANQESWLIGAH